MNTLWKWIMHLNAKAFCLVAALVFLATAAWCAFKYQRPPTGFQHGSEHPPSPEQPAELDLLDFVSNQLADTTLSIPIDPFRPTLEAIFTNETERAAFIKALKDAQARAAGVLPAGAAGKKEDPFAHLRQKSKVPDGTLVDATGRPIIIPKLTFLGFVERPDGSKAAMFHDSVENSTIFYDAGKQQVRNVDIVNADVREAQIRFPDGSVRNLAIGASIELAPEPAPQPKPGAKPAPKPGAKPAPVGRAPGARPRPGGRPQRQPPKL